MLPAVIAHLPADRKRLGLRPQQMAGHLHVTYRQYLALEAGELEIDNDLFERVVGCGWPRASACDEAQSDLTGGWWRRLSASDLQSGDAPRTRGLPAQGNRYVYGVTKDTERATVSLSI